MPTFAVRVDMEKLGGLLISQEDPDVREFVNALSESKLFTDDEIGKASVHYDNLTGMKNPIVYISRGRPWIMGLVGRQSNLPKRFNTCAKHCSPKMAGQLTNARKKSAPCSLTPSSRATIETTANINHWSPKVAEQPRIILSARHSTISLYFLGLLLSF